METVMASYREFVPCEALRPYVRAFFAFSLRRSTLRQRHRLIREVTFQFGEPYWSNLFADGHVSIVFSFGEGYGVSDLGREDARPCHRTHERRAAQFHGQRSGPDGRIFSCGAFEFFQESPHANCRTGSSRLRYLWGPQIVQWKSGCTEQGDELRRIELLESALLSRMASAPHCTDTIDIAGLANWISVNGGRLPLSVLAGHAGVSRQYFARIFHDRVGLTPKLYSRLARFKAGLSLISNANASWAQTALQLGYSDQSHMIAEFKEFSGRTPASFSLRPHFHPFSGASST